eukprot:TRINITY_DN5779_c0_g2_i1.p2 TRINITY_DN5779_c0_g2~~TRINITY_DN5779_c0_g2_i1.p2  ORF type:complete len:226 (+),score=68.57 TRINITY_DN5779_c0_g2_i1:117-794(+)
MTAQTSKVDVFKLGCVMFYALSKNNLHPFGDRDLRAFEILNDRSDLSEVQHLPDVHDLISSMIQYHALKRPTMNQVLAHPFFWEPELKLKFVESIIAKQVQQELDKRVPLYSNDWIRKLPDELVQFLNSISQQLRHRDFDGRLVSELLLAVNTVRMMFDDSNFPAQLRERIFRNSVAEVCTLFFQDAFPDVVVRIAQTLKREKKMAQAVLETDAQFSGVSAYFLG